MIAPIHQTDVQTSKVRRRLAEARRLVASAFLEEESASVPSPASVSAWRAWLFTGWVVIVVAVYFANMMGLF